MADLRPFMLMTDLQAARFREDTAGQENFLDPRYVEAGPYKGKYVLPERLLTDDTFAPLHPVMRMLTVVAVDLDTAWPPVEALRIASDAAA